MARRGHLRASDSDREQIADRLRHATAEGRLSTNELEHRLTVALSARTYAELDELIADLPGKGVVARRERNRSELSTVLRPALALAIAIPVALAVVATVAVVVAGVVALWWVWLILAWWMFGRRHCRRPGRRHYRTGPRYYGTAHRYR